MLADTDPWKEVPKPSSPDREMLRRVDPEHELDFYRGKRYGGGYFLRLVVDSEPPSPLVLPRLSNITVTLHSEPSGRCELTVTLTSPDYVELFRALSADLISSTRFMKRANQAQALSTVVARIVRWQGLLSTMRGGILDSGTQLGLFGELVLLRDIFLAHTDAFSALSAWRGPSGAEQDFQFARWLFEVKSQMTTSDKLIRVSSAHQLDLISGNIALFHQVFSTSDGAGGEGRTLRQMVDETRQQVLNSSPAAVDLFQARLIEAGYEPLEEYDVHRLVLSGRNAYEVTENFPRISASDLPPGVSNVRYDLSLESCSAFGVGEEELIGRAFDVE